MDESGAARAPAVPGAAPLVEQPPEIPAVVELEIGPTLDLHEFPPNETRHVVEAYLEEAVLRGLREVRIIHGRGTGVQRRIVQSLVAEHPLVVDYADADPGRGGWGATVVVLRESGEDDDQG
jgi:DNA-nicking Smr family endonuclease